MMRSASRIATAALRGSTRQQIDATATQDGLLDLADELYACADVLTSQPRLRRALADPASAPDRRARLAHDVFSGRVSDAAVTVVQAIVSQRWSNPWDMTDALEVAGDDALFAAAERTGDLSRVVDELFRFERILDAQAELVVLLDEAPIDADRRAGLLRDVVQGKVHPVTQSLLEHATRSQRKRNLGLAISALLDEAALRQNQSMARVLSAAELTPQQIDRLESALTSMYGRPITVQTALAPAVQGGLIIRIGDEVIDGSVAARLTAVRLGVGSTSSRARMTTPTRQGNH